MRPEFHSKNFTSSFVGGVGDVGRFDDEKEKKSDSLF